MPRGGPPLPKKKKAQPVRTGARPPSALPSGPRTGSAAPNLGGQPPAQPGPPIGQDLPFGNAGLFGMDLGTLVGQQALLPPPTFEGANPLDTALQGEIDRLNQDALGAARQGFGTDQSRIQQDLATRLAELERQRVQAREDQARQQAELQRQSGIQSEGIKSRFGASGVSGGGIVNAQVGESERGFQQAIDQSQRGLQREITESEKAQQEYQREYERAIEDLNTKRAEFERQVREGEIKSRAQREESRRGEATSWTRARYNQLLGAGVSEEHARSMSISEARAAYPNVGDTWIAGVFGAPKTEKPRKNLIQEKYGANISLERGLKTPNKEKNRKNNAYRLHEPLLDTYLRQAGNGANLEGFADFLVTNAQATGDSQATARAGLGRFAHVISQLWADKVGR